MQQTVAVNDFSPRIGDYAYKLPLKIDSVTTNTVTVNCGSAGTNTDVHTFVSADEGAVVKVKSTTQGVYARRILQKNKAYLQAEVTAWLEDNYFTYDKAKCERDTGYILNAVARDIATGSNVNAIYTGKGYRIGTVGANNVVNKQLTETVGAITWLKGKIATDVLANGTAITRSNAAFDEIIDIMSNGNAAADDVSFGGQSISVDAYNARAVLQANKAFIQKEVVAWIAANHPGFVYNQVACERDLGIFIDTASWDLQHGGNAATVNNSRLYFENALPVLSDGEIVPTSGAYEFASHLVGQLTRGETITPLQGVETQVLTQEESFTPSNATYDPVTGVMVLTIGLHTFAVDDRITVDPNAITFQCGFGGGGTDSHPNANDPNLGKPFVITAISGTSITVNAGSAGSNTDVHSFISANADSVRAANMADAYTPTNVVYDHISGVMTMTLGDRHRFAKGDYLIFDENAITLSCASNGGGNLSHPRPSDPIFNKPVRIDSVTGTTVTLQVGPAKVNAVHTFVSATTNGVRRSLNSVTANHAMELFSAIGETILENDGTIPAITETVYDLTSNYGVAIKADAEKVLGQKPKYQSEIIKHISETYNGLGYNEAKCPRDVGYIVDAISEDLEYGGDVATVHSANYYYNGTMSVLEPYSMLPTKLAFNHIADVVEKVVKNVVNEPIFGARFTPTNATYDTATGILVATIGTHTLTTDDHIWFTPDAITFSCDTGSGPTNHASPEAHHRFYNKACPVIGVTSTTITLWVGAFTGGTTHTFVSALTDGFSQITGNLVYQNVALPAADTATGTEAKRLANVIAEVVDDRLVVPDYTGSLDISLGQQTPYPLPIANPLTAPIMEPSRTFARKSLQFNREFIQEEVLQYLSDNFEVLEYSAERCRRDTGYIVDAISHDIQYGGNAAMHGTAELYFKNAINILPIGQRQATREAFEYMGKVVQHVVRNEYVPRKLGNKFSPTAGTYNPDTGIFTLTLGAGHNLNVGDHVMIAPESIVFTCSLDGDIAEHPSPQLGDPYYNAPYLITASDATTITMQVGKVAYGKGGGAHTFVRASLNAVSHVTGNSVKQEMPTLAARRTIATEAMELALMLAKVADDNDASAIPARVDPFTTWIDAGILAEKNVIDNATVQMATDLQTYIYDTYNGISYSKEKCRRDVGTMIDAISHDVNYTTNYASVQTAGLYFVNAVSVLPVDQRQQTAKFFTEMAEVISVVVTRVALDTTNSKHSSAEQDITTHAAATAVEAEEVKDLARIVEDAIRRNSIDVIPAIVEPNTSWITDNSVILAAQEIDDNLDELADDVTQFLKDTFTIIDYSKAKCRRDAGYILDAMSWDLNYGGNLATRWNAAFYFWNNELRVPEDTRVATAQAYRELGRIVSQVVLGEYPGQVIRTELGTEVQSTQANDLGLIFYNALFYNTVSKLGPTIKPNFAWETNKTFDFARQILNNNKNKIQRETQRFITSEYKFIDLPKTYRDAGNFLIVLQNDFKYVDPAINTGGSYINAAGGTGADTASRSFVGALFNIDAQHVFPVFNPPATFADWRKLRFKGTVEIGARNALTDMKRWDTYIIPTDNAGNRYIGDITYWTGTAWTATSGAGAVGANNTDLLESFIGAWTQMKTYINNNIAPDQEHRDMVTELIDNVIIDSIIRPDFLKFGSLVESIAHQFNGASAGVNRNALPLNFRNVGRAIGANASVLSENGGRIRWSGSDELNNQYFARGLKINGRTGRIEGRPFTSSVRKLARRASNSRATL